MKRTLTYISVIALIFCVIGLAHAQTVRSTFGNKDSSGEYTMTEKTDNIIYMRPSGGLKLAYEEVTTSDTITAVESGRTYAVDVLLYSEFELPAATVGMNFTFVSTDNTDNFVVDPNGTDVIKWSDSSSIPLDAGDKLVSPGATGDTLELFCATAGEWAVKNIKGTFTDGGA